MLSAPDKIDEIEKKYGLQIMTALRIIGTGRIAGFDMCCLSPLYDTPLGTGSQLAARCAVMVIGSIALKKMRS